jgi:hypothetical protein
MDIQTRNYCLSAVAYLKGEVTDDQEVHITLAESDSPVLRNLGHGLLAAYLVDEGEYYSYVQHRHLADSLITCDELHAQALANLTALAEKRAEVRPYGNIYAVLMGGDFEASIILVDEFWSEWNAQLAPDGFLAAFPARDLLAFGNASAAVITELNEFLERANNNVDHPLNSNIFRRVGSAWVPLLA